LGNPYLLSPGAQTCTYPSSFDMPENLYIEGKFQQKFETLASRPPPPGGGLFCLTTSTMSIMV